VKRIRPALERYRQEAFVRALTSRLLGKECDNDLKQTYSAAIGIVGGIVDLVAGLALLQPVGMMAGETMRGSSSAMLGGYFLLVLGVIVLLTGLYVLTSPMMKHYSIIGGLMFLYGAIMLVLGLAMLGKVFSTMQGSTLSGAVMLLLGAAMLYSGYGMRPEALKTR
jgi:uncharacterized membrane protein HdeD (DUF308 family)